MVKVKITQVKSIINRPHTQKATMKALRLGKINSSTIHVANPALIGMIKTISHLVKVEEVQ